MQTTIAEARSRVYWFLSEFFNLLPDEKVVRDWKRSIPEIDDNTELSKKLLELKDVLRNAEIERMQKAFTRLFRGIKEGYSPPPPYESVWRGENRVMGETTIAVVNFYSSCGFGIIDESTGPQDHITAELKFLAMLCWKESEDDALFWLRKEKEFMERHLLKWVPEFCKRIEKEGDEFYSKIAAITRLWIEMDYEFVKELLEGGG